MECLFCGKSNRINTSSKHRSGKRGPPAFNVNTRVALSCLHAGIGLTHINNVLATIDIPPLNSCTYKQREREVGRAVEYIAKTSCQDSLNRERAQALLNWCQPDDNNLVSIPYSFDMGWQKRGKDHNSRTGHSTAMSLTTGKVLDYVTKNKGCRSSVELQKGQADSQNNMIAEKNTQVHPRPWRLVLQLNFSPM